MPERMNIPEPSPERASVHESVNHRLAEVLRSAEVAGEGQDGLVLRIGTALLPEDILMKLRELGELIEPPDDVALKVLKVYEPGAADREMAMQRRANSILKPHEGDPAYAHVPKVYFVHSLRLSADEREALAAAGINVREKADVVLMDLVPGRDLRRILAAEFMQRSGNATQEQIGKSTDPSSDFVYQFLRKKGFTVHPSVADRLERTIKLLNAGHLFHKDLHEANIMVEGDPTSEQCGVSIIDFGRARTTQREEHEELRPVDELMVVRRIRAHQAEYAGVSEDERMYREDLERFEGLVEAGDPRWSRVREGFVADPGGALETLTAVTERDLSLAAFTLLGALREHLIAADDVRSAISRLERTARLAPLRKKLRWLLSFITEKT